MKELGYILGNMVGSPLEARMLRKLVDLVKMWKNGTYCDGACAVDGNDKFRLGIFFFNVLDPFWAQSQVHTLEEQKITPVRAPWPTHHGTLCGVKVTPIMMTLVLWMEITSFDLVFSVSMH